MSKKSKVERIKHSLQLDESIDLQERGWIFQRVGWYIIFLIMALAAIGVFGNGIVSSRTAEAGNIEMKYNRFLRFESETELKFKGVTQAINEVALHQNFFRKFKIEKINPEPVSISTTRDYVVYSYNPGQTHFAVIYITPQESGAVKTSVLLNGTATELSQFIYP